MCTYMCTYSEFGEIESLMVFQGLFLPLKCKFFSSSEKTRFLAFHVGGVCIIVILVDFNGTLRYIEKFLFILSHLPSSYHLPSSITTVISP